MALIFGEEERLRRHPPCVIDGVPHGQPVGLDGRPVRLLGDQQRGVGSGVERGPASPARAPDGKDPAIAGRPPAARRAGLPSGLNERRQDHSGRHARRLRFRRPMTRGHAVLPNWGPGGPGPLRMVHANARFSRPPVLSLGRGPVGVFRAALGRQCRAPTVSVRPSVKCQVLWTCRRLLLRHGSSSHDCRMT